MYRLPPVRGEVKVPLVAALKGALLVGDAIPPDVAGRAVMAIAFVGVVGARTDKPGAGPMRRIASMETLLGERQKDFMNDK